MTTKAGLFKLGANARSNTIKQEVKHASESILNRARAGYTTSTWVISGYSGETEYCKVFLSSIKEAFPDIDVVVTEFGNPATSYTFSWKD